MKKKKRWILYLIVPVLPGLLGCGFLYPRSEHTLRVHNVRLGVPDSMPPGDYTGKVVLEFTFSRPVLQSTLMAPGTVKIDVMGMYDARAVFGISGTFWFPAPPDDAAQAVFVSDKTLAELIGPLKGEVIRYMITVFGTQRRAPVVTDPTGEKLDGDRSGRPGGNFETAIKVPSQT